MTLRDATTIKIISDNNQPEAKTTLDGVVGTAIDTAMSDAALLGMERVEIHLDAVINGRTTPIEIVQSGGNLMLTDVCDTLKEKGYRISIRKKKSYRAGGQDRVTLVVAWGTV